MKEEDKNKEYVDMMNEACKMIKEWKKLNMIVGVSNNDGTLRMEKFEKQTIGCRTSGMLE